jgi:cell division protein ZapA
LAKTIDVEIYGQRYSIRGEADEAYVKHLARFVDDHMRTLAQSMKTATLAKLAILTAINLSHQVFEAERRRQQGEADVEKRMASLMESIEEQMPSASLR